MTLRPEYSLGNSTYNAFLFAAVGEEKGGLPLTVLTALTRLGFDPWREAARLSDLPRETAARAFAVTIATLPEGDWKASESEAIAARLVNWLPERSAVAIPSVGGGRAAGTVPAASKMIPSRAMTWLTWAVLAVAVLFLGLHLFGDHDLDVGRGTLDSRVSVDVSAPTRGAARSIRRSSRSPGASRTADAGAMARG